MKRRQCFRWLFVLGGLFLSQWEMPAASVSIQPIADTTLQQSYPDNNFGDGTTFTAGDRRYGGATRALVEFDVAGHVPAGATIDSVTLTLTVSKAPSGGGFNSVFDLHRVLDSWSEGSGSDMRGSLATANQSTWNYRFSPATPWSHAGGDFSSALSASRNITGVGAYTFTSTANLVGDVQGWLNNPANNFGWILMSESENSPTSIRRFASRDAVSGAPLLTINFTPVPEPGAWTVLAVGMLFIVWRLRRKAT